ncbi:tripartite tricarboxylate transporter substrate-binding protein [Comamonas endophytica]|uniref:Tripartite tricarboxylate transporter substrate-binding protein n=1 Tax=Comamonas endophytica TaxID=2949090 RepID=A0ABY6G5I0_9BURK|nr:MULTISPECIES: tripartite tricarboxylate transporter substrate-binding protein [unclassified Acidovorax]MCD2512281.1 tripartite tricarboxylate transporter substrate binding protein [Acidovorax sp. D4N7]UYG50262.1 tripartite tricarboxylate transporter substrate-binding protein [Acidovorax sp. 5MLIR]
MKFKHMLGALAVAALFAPPAFAQKFPTKPVRIVVPFGAGGVADVTARVVAQKMAGTLGQPVVIENKPGAGGIAAGDAVAKAAPDGHTLLLMSNATAVSEGLFRALPFKTLQDFAPVSTLGYFDLAVVTAGNSRFRNLGELLAFAKAHPGQLNLGSINVGSTQHLTAEMFKSAAGVQVQVVPFNGTPAVVTALRGGQIDAAVEIVAPVLTQIQSGALRALAVASDKRAAALPQVPTTREAGLSNYVARSWNGLAAPAKTPAPVIARLNQAIVAALDAPEVKKKLRELNVDAQSSTPQEAAALLASEVKRWGSVIQAAKIAPQ